MKRILLATTCLFISTGAFAQAAPSNGMQSPAYQECTAMAGSNPAQALAQADAWLKFDTGVAAQHCRAMSLYGLRRFDEAGDALASVRGMIAPESIALRSYVTRQAAKAFGGAGKPDKAFTVLGNQIQDISAFKGDNAGAAKLTAELLLDRAKLSASFGKLDDAAKDLDHAVSLTPINSEVLMERASVFEKLGDKSLAIADAQSVLKIESGHSAARDLIVRLGGSPAAPAIAAAPQQPVSVTAGTYAGTEPAAAPVKKAVKKRKAVKKPVEAAAAPAETTAAVATPSAPALPVPALPAPAAAPAATAPAMPPLPPAIPAR